MRARIGLLALALTALGLLSAAAQARRSPAAVGHAPANLAAGQRGVATRSEANAPAAAPRAPTTNAAEDAKPKASAFERLPALRVACLNTHTAVELKLYDAGGRLDETAAQTLDELLADTRKPNHPERTALDRRTLKLLFRAAYHFKATEVEVVSAYRKPGRRREGLHGDGRAIDFKLKGVKAATLAAYLRESPRVGVGIYTHPRTQYVHLDVREHSFHWLDASPPGRTWRERSLGGKALPAHDASYSSEMDLPEAALTAKHP